MATKVPNTYTAKMEKLIGLVCPHPCLYDTDHEHYKNVKLKEDIWNEVGSELNAPGSWAKKEWRKLRDCHRDALKRRVGRIEQDNKKWKFEDQMDFLLPYMKSRGTATEYSDYHAEQMESESDFSILTRDLAPSEMCDALIPSPSSCSSGTQKPMKRNQPFEKIETGLDYFEQSIKMNEAKTRRLESEKPHVLLNHPLDSFFESMCATTKTLPKKYQLKIKRTLFDCVLQAEEQLLTKENNQNDDDIGVYLKDEETNYK